MLKFQVLIGIIAVLGSASICNVNGDCTNSDGSVCTGTACCYDDLPPVLGSGGSIVPVQDCYPSGTGVIFNCTGDLKGPPFNDCTNGAWGFPFGPTCEPATTCSTPTVPTNGGISPDGPYDLYTRISYSCKDGYSLVGPSEAVCESGGVWNPSTTPTCEADCTKPTLANGGVVPDQPTFSNTEVLTYQCDANYTLVGVSTTTCRNGVFDPATLPICYAMCLPPVVDNSDYSSQQPPVDHASTITIECDSGYSTGTGIDKDFTCNDGTFDDKPPVCYANCPPLSPSFDNGARSGDTTPFYHNEQVSYTCNNGYTLVGSSSITCNDGSWSDAEPVCKENSSTVIKSSARLECRNDSIRVKIDHSDLSDVAVDALMFEGDPTCTGVVDGDDIVFTTRLAQCGTTQELDGDLDIYKNLIVSGLVTNKAVTVSFPITCFYERAHRLGYGYSEIGSAGVPMCRNNDMIGECTPCESIARRRRGASSAHTEDLSVGPVHWIKEESADIKMAVDVTDEDSARHAVRPWMTAVAVMATVIGIMLVVIVMLVRKNGQTDRFS